jgi:hypothetical protein
MKPEVKCSVARYPFSSRGEHYLSRVAQFVAFVDFLTGGSEEKVEGWLGEVYVCEYIVIIFVVVTLKFCAPLFRAAFLY